MTTLIRSEDILPVGAQRSPQDAFTELLDSASQVAARAADFDVSDYMLRESEKDLLRFSTAGSVDDGKSTLIGRLLYDTQSVYDDQLQSIEGKGTTAPGVLDLALLTDGLRAEREQGITIDVAYRYFSTQRRKFIIADTPGHEEYTRNMATGASTASAAIVLIDARKGVLPQSRRHASITALLGVRHIIVAVNKMDLVGYAESTFTQIRADFTSFFHALDIPGAQSTALYFVPVSALVGDNIVHASTSMPWYSGKPLLALLESIPAAEDNASCPFRLAVQRVVRPSLDFRGFAGQIASGTIRVGDPVVALPSGRSSRVQRIVTFDGDLTQATAPLAVTLTLEHEIDISRGDVLTAASSPATVATSFQASLVWMDAAALDISRRYLLKHMSRAVPARIDRVVSLMNLSGISGQSVVEVGLNAIAVVEIASLLPLAMDKYEQNRTTGSFVLIDPLTNATVAAGMIRTAAAEREEDKDTGAVTESERATRFGHGGAVLHVHGPDRFAELLERTLFKRGTNVFLTGEVERSRAALVAAGLLVLLRAPKVVAASSVAVSVGLEQGEQMLDLSHLVHDLPGAVTQTIAFLHSNGILHQETSL